MRALAIAMLLFGCDGMMPPPPTDAGYYEPALEVGIGEAAFSPFDDGQTLPLVCGNQGLQHVWISLRAWGINPLGTIHDFELTNAAGEVLNQVFEVRVSMMNVPEQPYFEIYGLTLVVPEPDRAIGEDLTLRVTTRPMDEHRLEAVREIRVDWETPGGCIRN